MKKEEQRTHTICSWKSYVGNSVPVHLNRTWNYGEALSCIEGSPEKKIAGPEIRARGTQPLKGPASTRDASLMPLWFEDPRSKNLNSFLGKLTVDLSSISGIIISVDKASCI